MDSPDETLLFLDFKNQLPTKLLQSKVFLRLARLEGPRPLVQVNDQIFQGTYEDSIGTNLFFNKIPNDSPPEFPFFDPLAFKLERAGCQSKVLACSQMVIPNTSDELLTTHEDLKFNLNWEYKELLHKFRAGTLDLQDMIAKEAEDNEEAPTEAASEISDQQERPMDGPQFNVCDVPDVRLSDELEDMYNRLLMLARTPVRHTVAQEVVTCKPQFQQEYDYKAIEAKVLSRPLFAYLKQHKERNDLDSINAEKCCALGLLAPSSLREKTLQDADKSRVMTVENFENLDLPARHSVLLSHAEELNRQIKANSAEQNQVRDEYGRTPLDTLSVFNRLLVALQKRIQQM